MTHAPVFLSGLKTTELEPLAASRPAASPPAASQAPLPDVWLSVLPPSTTARPYLVLGGYNKLPLRVHNDGRGAATGEIEIELTCEQGVLATGRIPFDVAAGDIANGRLATTLPSRQGTCRTACHAPHRRIGGRTEHWRPSTCRSGWCDSKAIEFAANSWVEQQYLHKAEKSKVWRFAPLWQRVRLPLRPPRHAVGPTADQRGGQRCRPVEAAGLQGRQAVRAWSARASPGRRGRPWRSIST